MGSNRRDSGRRAKAAGDSFEEWVESQHTEAERLGILAHVEHNEPHSRIVGGRIIYTAAGVADYTGTLEGGRSAALEAKSVADVYLPRARISPTQQDHLSRVGRAGGLALLLVEFRVSAGYLRYAVPWLSVPWKVKKTAESVSMEDLPEWVVHPDCYLLKFHNGGVRSTPTPVREKYARE